MDRPAGALLCPPTYFTVRDVKNPFMKGAHDVDSRRAREQWDALRLALDRAGLPTAEIAPVEDLEDMVFAANQVFVGSGAVHARFIVPSRMRFASREREVPFYVAWFASRGFDVLDLALAGDEYLEGHGDLLWHPGASRIWAGHGFRSSRSGVERFSAAMRAEGAVVTPLQLIDETFYHLDTCFAPLNDSAALYYPGAFAPSALDALRDGWPRLHEVTRDEALTFACNGIAANGTYVASQLSERIAATLRAEGLAPVTVDLSEFEKAGGSAFCMKAVYPQ